MQGHDSCRVAKAQTAVNQNRWGGVLLIAGVPWVRLRGCDYVPVGAYGSLPPMTLHSELKNTIYIRVCV